jgi:hypothetical protein
MPNSTGTFRADRPDPNDRLIGDRMIDATQHAPADLPSARHHLKLVVAGFVTSDYRHVIRFQLDPWAAARVFLARIPWLQGFPDQAMRAF